ncbi:MAG TPA: DUF177 domain-containing protein [Stellaceae bacterium]|jgi:uncharacterized metal-binding protein YceD (DUF177 family)|nr:DUF177 domain-containing protein [Stellaceae bacterium]
MPEDKTEKAAAAPWQVPVAADAVAETGQHFDLVADAAVRSALARLAGLRDLPRLQASFDVSRRGAGGLHVAGTVSATVGQNCVVTLEPLVNDVHEAVDLVFLPREPAAEPDEDAEPAEPKWKDPEPLIGGAVDLGVIAIEFLLLGLDPYPRKPGAVFEPLPDRKPDEGPFAALAKLAKN